MAEKLALNSRRDGECLRWTGAHIPTGYGQLSIGGKVKSVHRIAYELMYGEIADELEIDHVAARGCKWRDCIEPTHLEAVTHAENLRRIHAGREPVCPKGHHLTEANIQLYQRSGNRGIGQRCRRCANDRRNRWRANRKLVSSVVKSA
ncbi:HNH endonuclease [Nocardia tengchongensis]|uniref:HNH endonuclease n=1 Tax=Nocardia tengchongensis TaxID=2055889 RepID=UPI003613EF58